MFIRTRRTALTAAGALLAAGALASSAQAGAFPGTNGRVAFESSPVPASVEDPTASVSLVISELSTAAADGSDVKPLVSSSKFAPLDPSMAPDGKTVAYVRHTAGYDRVHVLRADGTDTQLVAGDDTTAPAWSPDGKKIAYIKVRQVTIEDTESGLDELWVANADGSDAHPVDMGGFGLDAGNPQWSPDGDWIAFDARLGPLFLLAHQPSLFAGLYAIGVVPAAGGQSWPVAGAIESADSARFPNWAPDGSALVYEVDGEGGPEIRRVSLEDGNGADEGMEESLAQDARRPAYSPDGTKIIFSRAGEYYGDDTDLYTMDAATPVNADHPAQRFIAAGGLRDAADWAPAAPAAPAKVEQPKAPVVSVGGVAGEQQRRCGSRRYFTIRIRPRGEKLLHARVVVNGKVTRVKRGRRWTATVDLRTLPKGRFKVDVTVWAKSGRRYHETRRYLTCTPSRTRS